MCAMFFSFSFSFPPNHHQISWMWERWIWIYWDWGRKCRLLSPTVTAGKEAQAKSKGVQAWFQTPQPLIFKCKTLQKACMHSLFTLHRCMLHGGGERRVEEFLLLVWTRNWSEEGDMSQGWRIIYVCKCKNRWDISPSHHSQQGSLW